MNYQDWNKIEKPEECDCQAAVGDIVDYIDGLYCLCQCERDGVKDCNNIVLDVMRFITVKEATEKEHTTLNIDAINKDMSIIQNFSEEHLDEDDLIYIKKELEKTISDINKAMSIISTLKISNSKELLDILSEDLNIVSRHLERTNF